MTDLLYNKFGLKSIFNIQNKENPQRAVRKGKIMNGITILGAGSYTPSFAVSNDMLTEFIDTSDEWISSRTGIRNRYMSPDKANYEMAAEAAKAALKNAGKTAQDIDFIIVSTCSPDFYYPNMACLVQKQIGAENCPCIDINSACTGFINSLDVARNYLATGDYKTILIVSSERLSPQIDFKDRGSCILFGDGAGAVVVEYGENKPYYSILGAEGDMFEALYCKANYKPNFPEFDGNEIFKELCNTPEKECYLQMDGKAVYKFAVDAMASAVDKVLTKAGCTIDDIDIVVPHQANIRIIQSALKKMKVDDSKVLINLQDHGNTSSACIPVALAELMAQGRLERGMKVCLVGFGAGLTYGACIFEY